MTVETTPQAATGRAEIRDGMEIVWDLTIEMDDGAGLKANLFKPPGDQPVPVLLSHGPYGKDMPMQDGYRPMWELLVKEYPDALEHSSNQYQSWELLDPEKWVPEGYALLRVDSRGTGRSPGMIDFFGPREIRDLCRCIEWAGTQEWSSGRVGLAGISYYATAAWHVASMSPPPEHLAAICPWEGNADRYRDNAYHGGIGCEFVSRWFETQVARVQYGVGDSAGRNPVSGLAVAGDETLSAEELVARRHDVRQEFHQHPFDGPYWRGHSARLEALSVPLLSAGNWGGHGLHLRGNVQAYREASTADKWLEMHGREHWTLYYSEYGRRLQKRFFDYFLKDEGDWRDSQPPVLLQIRHPDDTFTERAEQEWPLARTRWTSLYLEPSGCRITGEIPAEQSSVEYEPFGDGVTFWAQPFDTDVEITGPLSAKLWISSQTADADLFLVVRAFDPDGAEVLFRGSGDPRVPLAQGWLRASHRALESERSMPWQPYHPHARAAPLVPGDLYEVDVEIWPTCLAAPAGYRLALTVLGRDFDHGLGPATEGLGALYADHPTAFRGCGPWVHDDPALRPREIYNGRVTIHGGGATPSRLLVPFIPAD